MRAALSRAGDAMALVGDDGTVLALSDPARRLLARLDDQAPGDVLRGLLGAPTPGALDALPARQERSVLSSDGSVLALEVAVVAGPDPRLGERPVAFLRAAPGAEPPTLADLRAHLRAVGLARQKWPEELHVVTDLPRTPSGKVRKVELRARLRSDAASTRTG